MRFSFTALLAVLPAFALTLPRPSSLPAGLMPMTHEEWIAKNSGSLLTRTPGGVFLCTGILWTGTCGYAVQPLDQCIDLTAPYKNNVGSFGPDPGATCFFYVENSCDEAIAEISSPGTSDVYEYDGGIPNSITNFMCE